MSLKSAAKLLIPPIVLQGLMKLRNNRGITFEGDYSSWQAALHAAGGYDAPAILERVRAAALKVKQGKAVFERDSVCFEHEEYRWPTLTCLLQVAAENHGTLHVLDFGGSLGNFYQQHRKFLSKIPKLRWSVVEQPHFVACGKSEFEDATLKFYSSIASCVSEQPVDIALFSSVLQYLPNPLLPITDIAKAGNCYALIDRTAFIDGEKDRLTIQHVPASIYKASYPAWFLSWDQFNKKIQNMGFHVFAEFPCDDDVGIGEFKGMLLERIEG